MDNKKVAMRVKELVAQGVSMEDAISKALEENVPQRITDRVAWVRSLDNISELRKALHSAFGKKSKAKNNSASLQKYVKEIEACKARLNELLAQVNTAENPIAKAIELGESPDGVLQLWLESKEMEVDAKVLLKKGTMTNKQLKEVIGKQDPITPDSIKDELKKLGEEYLETFESRIRRGDQRCQALNRRVRFIQSK